MLWLRYAMSDSGAGKALLFWMGGSSDTSWFQFRYGVTECSPVKGSVVFTYVGKNSVLCSFPLLLHTVDGTFPRFVDGLEQPSGSTSLPDSCIMDAEIACSRDDYAWHTCLATLSCESGVSRSGVFDETKLYHILIEQTQPINVKQGCEQVTKHTSPFFSAVDP